MYKKHCFTQGLTKVIILLVICDISFCYNFVMKMFVIWPCFLVHTFKTSRLKSLTTSSRVPHYLVQVPHKCIQCYWGRQSVAVEKVSGAFLTVMRDTAI